MAEPLVDKANLGGPQDTRKLSSTGRPSSGVYNGGERGSTLNSPVSSPRSPESSQNYNIDASGSTYALQVALKNMKERYHKLQKKMALIEDDNSRLITGKSELFGEIGKLQENSIKLREKNLQLNHEIHSKHQECCSLKERFSSFSQENMSLARQLARATHDNRRLTKQVGSLSEENQRLKEKMGLIASQVRALPGGSGVAAGMTNFAQLTVTSHRTKITASTDDLESFEDLSRFHSPVDDDQVSEGTDALTSDWLSDEDSEDEESKFASKIQIRMRKLLASLQEQNQGLLLLSPFMHSVALPPYANNNTGTIGQRDRGLSTMTVTPPSAQPRQRRGQQEEEEEEEEEDGVCQSRLATCGSVINSSVTSANGMHVSPLTDDSGGDNNVHIGGVIDDRPQSPFDWRQVQMSDDEGVVGREGNSDSDTMRPDTRTVSTSPDPSLGGGVEEVDRICPMCNAVFPQVVPQESFESHVVSHFEVENGFEVIS